MKRGKLNQSRWWLFFVILHNRDRFDPNRLARAMEERLEGRNDLYVDFSDAQKLRVHFLVDTKNQYHSGAHEPEANAVAHKKIEAEFGDVASFPSLSGIPADWISDVIRPEPSREPETVPAE